LQQNFFASVSEKLKNTDGSTTPEITALLARMGVLEAIAIDHQSQLVEFERTSLDFLLVICGIFVFTIQLGFMLYEAGSVRSKTQRISLLRTH
jgi:hypothetical protein